jgi:hypothetical protein
MRGRKKRKIKYKAEYRDNKLDLKLERINLWIDLDDHLEAGLFLKKFREAGLGSSRELGRLFRKSASTVINKDRFSQIGTESLIDGRGQKKRYKIEEIKEEILYRWAKNPMASDKELHQQLQPRLSSLSMKLDLKTLTRFTKEAGIDEVRSRLRAEQALVKKDIIVTDNREPGATGEDKKENAKEITQTYSRYAGQMLHVPHLYGMNFPKMIDGLPSPWEEYCVYSRERVCHQIYFLYAMQEERLYDLDSVVHGEFGALIVMPDNLRSSGMNKRVKRMATPGAIEVFQKEALAGRSHLITRKDMELCCGDTHVIEVWVNKLIPMARHGTKAKQVKAINAHYLIGSDTGTPLSKIYAAGNKRLHWSIPNLIKKAEEGLKRKIGIVSFDKGGFSLKTVKSLIKARKAFVCWGKRSEYMKRQINRLKPYRFRWRRKKEIRQDGKLIKTEERIADTTTRLKGLGKVRTVVVQLPEIEGGERLWLHTNLSRRSYSSIEIRDMIRFKQREENYFKTRKHKGALDCFAGGRCKVKAISRPTKKFLSLLRKQLRRLGKRIEKDQESVREAKELKEHGVYPGDTAKREINYLDRRIKQNMDQKKKTEENIRWAEGGDRPEFIKQRYELELEKQELLNEFADLAMLSKRESLKEFLGCYKKVLEKDNLPKEEISQRMEYLDTSAIEKELFNLGGFITCDKRENKMTIMIVPQGREYFRKALVIFLHRQNKKGIVVQYSSKEKYHLRFCLAPSPISTN